MTEPRISEAESRVMAVIWDGAEAGRGGAGVEDILAAAGAANGWSETTVRTLIHRLIRKDAVASERRGGLALYTPKVSREAWVTAESQGFLDRLFGGQIAPLVAHFARQRGMDPTDLARLRKLVAELDAEAAEDD
ncbi:BlaI/MecI/CopY family transcriptional regulator [Phenylobacterium kunshanense]|uniref:BlaI/MecI/CopY family transcriptional regulator n=1 Tax=Phenylobacterium kunshanense TaxID=1445034 RepID=A0A328B987_9CAUL|nr:BlaI/MecI/CopY family transcriptional regulator [Phenylobacterium kunshanense]RAK62991.1 BlaI/MecI/CopY family transcriptional regulator [Phenylobacterium kunshanense]